MHSSVKSEKNFVNIISVSWKKHPTIMEVIFGLQEKQLVKEKNVAIM